MDQRLVIAHCPGCRRRVIAVDGVHLYLHTGMPITLAGRLFSLGGVVTEVHCQPHQRQLMLGFLGHLDVSPSSHYEIIETVLESEVNEQ